MAVSVPAFSIELSPIERQWIVASLEFKRAGLVRAARLEMAGSEIHTLRNREIAQVDALTARLNGG